MRFDNVSISSVAAVDATHRLASAEIEQRLAPTMERLGIPPGMLEGLTGIAARRVFDPDFMPSEAATLAARDAIAQANVDPNRLGILVNTSVCRDYVEPSTACLVHGNLGLPSHCLNFDLSNACLGFLSGMEVVSNMIERGQIDYGIVVDGENSRFIIDTTIERLNRAETTEQEFRDAFATFTLGSGGVAMVLCRHDLAPDAPQFKGGVGVAATQHSRLCHGQVDRMYTETKALLVAGIELAKRTLAEAKQVLGWEVGAFDELVLHQVSKVHTEKLAHALELDPAKIHAIFPEYGNVGPAAVPMVLAHVTKSGRVTKGDRVALMGIGSGLNCAMHELVW